MQLYWEEILVLMSPTSSLSTSVNSRHGFSTMKIKRTFLSKNLLEMVTLFKILCIVTQKVKSSSLRETCRFLKYNEWDSLCSSCYLFISILHEKFIAVTISIYCKNQTQAELKL